MTSFIRPMLAVVFSAGLVFSICAAPDARAQQINQPAGSADEVYQRFVKLAQTGGDAKAILAAAEEFLKAAPKDPRAPQLFLYAATRAGEPAAQREILARVVKEFPDSPQAAMAKGQIAQSERVGKPFELKFTEAVSGDSVSMDKLRGKVVVIDFWATWCGPCVAEMPKMKELYATYKPQGVEFIGVSLDQPEAQGGLTKLKDFCRNQQIAWPQYYQGNGWESEFSRSWGINSIPAVFIVDANGNLYSTQARGQLEKLIPELIKKRDAKTAG